MDPRLGAAARRRSHQAATKTVGRLGQGDVPIILVDEPAQPRDTAQSCVENARVHSDGCAVDVVENSLCNRRFIHSSQEKWEDVRVEGWGTQPQLPRHDTHLVHDHST
jgi:Ethanolamine utilization protein EutJ (predicted chaperonin)